MEVFSDAYMYLSDICQGRPVKKLTDRTEFFLYHCLVKLAEHLESEDISKAQAYLSQLESFEHLQGSSVSIIILVL